MTFQFLLCPLPKYFTFLRVSK